MKNKFKKLLICASFFITPMAIAQTEVSVLMIYTDDARAAVGGTENIETEIISAISDGNFALDNSNIDMELSIAGMREISVNENNYSGTSQLLADLTDPNDSTFGIVHDWRDEDGADIVYLIFEGIIQNGQANGICGSGNTCDQSFESEAFATGQRALQDVAPIVIHELGHVMGLRHDRTRDCGSEVASCGASLFPYSFGHIDPDGTTDWGTIMAGGRPFPLLDFFSNPNLDHPDTGQALGVVDRSDTSRALNNVREIIASFREPTVTPIPTPTPTSTPIAECTIEESFETGTAGWSNSAASSCISGAFVVGSPVAQANGGVTTQVGGAADGASAFFTATNTSAGVNDVDGGNCIATSPTYDISENSELSLSYFFGQRDAGDDPTGDFQLIEISIDGGSTFSTLVANGDNTSNAAWLTASQTVPAGADVVIRAQCADGSALGDLVECGIDNVKICSN